MATTIDRPMEIADITRTVISGERAGYNTTEHLAHAKRQAIERNYQDLLIVDADAHHYETESWADIIKYIEDPVLRHRAAQGGQRAGPSSLMVSHPGNQSNSGRVIRYPRRSQDKVSGGSPRDVELVRSGMDAIGLRYQIVFPTPMLELGMHQETNVERELSWAYSRWLTEEILPHEPRMKTMVYLPFNTPSACMRVIEHFTGKPGVVGFMVTSPRHRPVHDNVYMPIYRALEERNMPLGFHAGLGMGMERAWEGMNRFISVHALGFTWFNIVHMTNMVINGIPERFPKLKIVWIESGLAWIPFLMQRLDNEYMMRTSEAPLLKMKPSEYMRTRFYYTTQPIENTNLEALQFNLKMINAENTLMFASDFPHWDFNLPSTIYDLPFLSEQAKRNILGETAREVYNLAA